MMMMIPALLSQSIIGVRVIEYGFIRYGSLTGMTRVPVNSSQPKS